MLFLAAEYGLNQLFSVPISSYYFIIIGTIAGYNFKRTLLSFQHNQFRLSKTKRLFADLLIVALLPLPTLLICKTPLTVLYFSFGILLASLLPTYQLNLSIKHVPFQFVRSILLFEWRIAIRKNLIPILTIYIATFLLTFKNIGFGFIGIMFLPLLQQVGFNYFEPINTIRSIKAKHFLIQKALLNILVILLVNVPFILVMLLKNNDVWAFICYAVLVSSITTFFQICYKYSCIDFEETEIIQPLPLVLVFVFQFIPFLFPVSVIMTVNRYIQARKKLKELC